MTRKLINSGNLYSNCRTGKHERCSGSTLGKRKGQPVVYRCECDCHQGQDLRCIDCYATEDLTSDVVCVDRDACKARVHERLSLSPLYQEILECREAASVARETKREPRKMQRKAQARARSGRCEHCGSPTRGGRFTVGHDAKLKGDLLRAAIAGEAEAWVEIQVRGWDKASHDDQIPARVRKAATKIDGSQEWLRSRIQERVGANQEEGAA